MQPKYECLRKIITLTVEYADFGGEENFITEENVLAETFSEAEKVLAVYLEGRQYHIISYCWKHSVISTPPNNACSRPAFGSEPAVNWHIFTPHARNRIN